MAGEKLSLEQLSALLKNFDSSLMLLCNAGLTHASQAPLRQLFNYGPLELLLLTAMAFAHCFCCAMLLLHAAPNLRVYAVSAAAGFQLLLLYCMAAAPCCHFLTRVILHIAMADIIFSWCW